MLVPEILSEEFVLTAETSTVRALMADLGRRVSVNLFKGDDDLIDFLDVKLNGRKIDFYPVGVDTALKDGDQVLVRLVPIGGG
jgi:molybdopterin converting factor small subunit